MWDGNTIKGCENPRTSENVCAVQPVELSPEGPKGDGYNTPPRTFRGLWVFVYVDCYTGQKRAAAATDGVFGHHGVSLPDDSPYWETLTEHWKKTQDLPEWRTVDESLCNGLPNRELPDSLQDPYTRDCIEAIAALRENAGIAWADRRLVQVAVSTFPYQKIPPLK